MVQGKDEWVRKETLKNKVECENIHSRCGFGSVSEVEEE